MSGEKIGITVLPVSGLHLLSAFFIMSLNCAVVLFTFVVVCVWFSS